MPTYWVAGTVLEAGNRAKNKTVKTFLPSRSFHSSAGRIQRNKWIHEYEVRPRVRCAMEIYHGGWGPGSAGRGLTLTRVAGRASLCRWCFSKDLKAVREGDM